MSWEADAAQARQTLHRKRQKELAWVTAALQRSKRLPDLARLLDEPTQPRGPKQQQTWQEMKAALKAITGHG